MYIFSTRRYLKGGAVTNLRMRAVRAVSQGGTQLCSCPSGSSIVGGGC